MNATNERLSSLERQLRLAKRDAKEAREAGDAVDVARCERQIKTLEVVVAAEKEHARNARGAGQQFTAAQVEEMEIEDTTTDNDE